MKDRPNGYAVKVGGVVWGAFPRKRRKAAYEYAQLVGAEMASCEDPKQVWVEPMPFDEAVYELRKLMFHLADFRCAKCGRTVLWKTGEMHEKVSRGKGGPRTRHNCEILCNAHHTGHAGEHGPARGRLRVFIQWLQV